jgi:[protein-PII] uridylyltransferase
VLDSRGAALRESYQTTAIANAIATKLKDNAHIHIPLQPVSKKIQQFKFPSKVSFLKNNSKHRTTIEIISLDRAGLLANIAQVFLNEELSIHSAKITTFGEKADDVFTISTRDNDRLTDLQKQTLTDKLLDSLQN